MYKLKETIENVRGFTKYEGGLLYAVKNKLFLYNTDEEYIISENFKEYCDSDGIFVEGDRILIRDTWGQAFLGKVGEWQFTQLPYDAINPIIVNNEIIILKPKEMCKEGEYYNLLALYDINSKKISKHFFDGTTEWIDGYLYTKSLRDVKLSRIDIETGKAIWEIDISKYRFVDAMGDEVGGELVNFITVYNNQLWLLIAKNRILILDNETGEVIYDIKDFVEDIITPNRYIGLSSYAIWCKKWQVDKENKKLHLLYRHFYIQMDLETREVKLLKSYLDMDREDRWDFHDAKLVGGKLYFIGNNGTLMFAGQLGVFDIKKREVVWEGYDIKQTTKFWMCKMEVIDDLLIGYDSGDTLYIFEKEK